MEQIDGKYTVLRKLGQGFGGTVYLIETNGERAALKQLLLRKDHPSLSSDEVLQNFKEEFSTLKKLQHPHILRILDFGRDSEKDFYYFTTEYIEGEDIFQATRGLNCEEIEELFVQVLRSLSYLHTQKIYHFDIKPGNILVEKSDGKFICAKLIDFGLAAFRKQGFLAGTPGYLAPESFLDIPKDGRTDLYSLGVTWYTCLAGKNPFEAENIKQTVTKHRVWMPQNISEVVADVPLYTDSILGKLLQKNPSERYHRADQVIRDLNFLGGKNYPLETEATALSYLPGEGKLVGRENEWAELFEIFNRVFSGNDEAKACVLLSGNHGIGKSRLISELKYNAQLRTVPIMDLRGTVPGHLKSNSLLVADNADSETLERARQWMQSFSTHSFLIVLAGDVAPDSNFPGKVINLQNLKKTEVEQYIASVLGVQNPPPILVEALHARSEGNPLFLTEMLENLIRSHQIFDDKGRWTNKHLQDLGVDFRSIPTSKNLAEYCQKKFERLEEGSKKLVAYMAIATTALDRIDIRKLLADSDNHTWELAENENLIRLDPITGQFSFLNPSFKDWILNHLPTDLLSQLHQDLAELYRVIPQKQEVLPYHLGFGTGTHKERFTNLLKYGAILTKRCDWESAAFMYKKASQLTLASQDLVDVNLRRADALFRSNHRSEAIDILENTREILKKEKENPQHWRWIQSTYREMASIYLKESRFDLAREAIQASMVLLEEHQEDLVEKLVLDNFRASILMREGKLNEASKCYQSTLATWVNLPDEKKEKILNNELGNIHLAQGKYQEAKLFYQDIASFCQNRGNLSKLAYALYGAAESCFFLNEASEARELYETCASISRNLKNEELLLHTYNGLGNLAYNQKDWGKAAEHYQEALELSQHSLDTNSTVCLAVNLASVLHLQGDAASALVYLNHAIETLEAQIPPSLHQVQFLARAYLELGILNLEGKQYFKARDVFRDATRLIRHYPVLEKYRFSALRGLAESNFKLGQLIEAENLIQQLDKCALTSTQVKDLRELKAKMNNLEAPNFTWS